MIFYVLVSWIDSLIYRLIETIFKVILYLADIQVLSDGIIGDLTNKVYAFLAILMFFKIAVSTIQYIVNPDELSNSDKGVGGILKNTAIAIILLVVVPEIFKFARSKQAEIASFIPAIILDQPRGNTNDISQYTENIRTQASNMAWDTFNAFVATKDGSDRAPIAHDWGKARAQTANEVQNLSDSIYYKCHKDCVSIVNTKLFCLPSFDDSDCEYKYNMLASTAAGLLMVLVLVSMAVDIAIRAIKLSILEVMAPIPIVSYINKAKSGPFEAWLKECKDVYLDLFIRLIVIFFIVYLIGMITADFRNVGQGIFSKMGNESFDVKALVFIFLIIGLLLFAKNAPKFITDILGIKGSDSITGMFKRASGMVGTAFGAGKSGIAGAVNTYRKRKAANGGSWGDARTPEEARLARERRNKALREAARAGLRGQRSALWAGTRASLSGKGFKEARDASTRAADRSYDLFEARKDAHVNWLEYQKEIAKRRIGIRQDLETLNAEIKAAQESSDKSKAALDYVHNNLGAKFANVKFATEFLNRMQNKIDGSSLKGDFVVGVNADGSLMKVNMQQMGENGPYSINTVMSRLQSTIKDEDGSVRKNFVAGKMKEYQSEIDQNDRKEDLKFSDISRQLSKDERDGKITTEEFNKRLDEARKACDKAKTEFKSQKQTQAEMEADQIKSTAQKMLDDLQGFADQFIVGVAGLSTDKAHEEETKRIKERVGFSDNPAFSRIIEEAKAAIIVNSSSSFGRDTTKQGQDSKRTEGQILDSNGHVIEGMLGDWLALNKKAGQDAQTQNIATQSTDATVAAQAAAKKIADQYDKKS